MKPKKLPYNKFLESFKYAPRPAVNLLLERTREGSDPSATKGSDPVKEVLLTKRKKPPFAGSWHLPGSFVLKGEALMDCVKRVAKEELGIKIDPTSPRLRGARIEKKNIRLIGAFDDLTGDPRGHVVDLVYQCRIDREKEIEIEKKRRISVGDTAEMRFFKNLPRHIGFNHRETLRKLGYE